MLVILSDEGGLPVYTRSISVDDRGNVKDDENINLESKNEQILLMSGLIEAIMQLKEIVKPALSNLKDNDQQQTPIYVDYAKSTTGMSLVSISTSPEFQQLPAILLAQNTTLQTDLGNAAYDHWETNFNNMIEGPLNEDAAIYWRILSKIRKDLAEYISFILVFDEEGNYLFSTSKEPKDSKELSDPLVESISRYIKQVYIYKRYQNNLSLIGSKKLSSSVIWHFKCFNRIFVFFTYIIPAMYDFDILKSELITFISNNLEKFIEASRTHCELTTSSQDVKSSRFIFLP